MKNYALLLFAIVGGPLATELEVFAGHFLIDANHPYHLRKFIKFISSALQYDSSPITCLLFYTLFWLLKFNDYHVCAVVELHYNFKCVKY